MSDRPREFTDRETTLPADPAAGNVYGAGLAKKGEAVERAPLYSPGIDYDVRSTYDVRPINGYDFNIVVSVTTPYAYALNPIEASFIVRSGFVAVIRSISHFFVDDNGTLAGAPFVSNSECRLTMRRNGADYPDNVGIPVGAASTRLPLFLLADENDTVTASFEHDANVENFPFSLWVTIYGNYLLKTNRPFYLEIANPAGGSGDAPPLYIPPAPKVQAPKAPAPIAPPVAAPAPMAPVRQGPPFVIEFLRRNVLSSGGRRGAAAAQYLPAKRNPKGQLVPLSQSEIAQWAGDIRRAAAQQGVNVQI